MQNQLNKSAIFLLGVPRSGTTLLRMMIDSHPEIMCGPEAPWIAGWGAGKQPNLKELALFLANNKWGAVKGLTGVEQESIYDLIASLIDGIMSKSAQAQAKRYWADKTPTNIIAVPFLYSLFPNAKFVHIFRDGRDVALSTRAAHWKTINFEGQRVKNNYGNALKRWCTWIEQFHTDTKKLGLTYISVRYENLVCSPKEEMQKILDFLEIPWNDLVLSPHRADHDIVNRKGEGIKSFYKRHSIDTNSLYRWKSQLNWFDRRLTKVVAEKTLMNLGYEATS